jgi:signal transduction histidine kinase
MPGIETSQKENHTAFKTVEQTNGARIVELVALERIGRELNSTFDLDQVLGLLIRQVVDLTPAVCGSVLLIDGQVETLQPRAWYGYTAPQVVTNLMSNAHKYSPDGAQIAITGQHENGRLMIQVRDAGIGISATDQRRLFTRFFRTNDAVLTQESGTGLGVAICREIMQRHHGEIEVESEVGKGSTFRLVLPVDAATDGKALERDAR